MTRMMRFSITYVVEQRELLFLRGYVTAASRSTRRVGGVVAGEAVVGRTGAGCRCACPGRALVEAAERDEGVRLSTFR